MTDEYSIDQAFLEIESELIASMIRNFEHHRAEETKEGIQWSMWQAEQLKALEVYKRHNKKLFTPHFGKINNSLEKLIYKAKEIGEMEQEIEILDAIKKGFKGRAKKGSTVQGAFFKTNERKLAALIDATTNNLKKAEVAVLRMANDKYRKIIYSAQVYAASGAGTYEQAVDMATKAYLSSGINCVEYANGARVGIASYAQMAIQTANKRAYLMGEGQKRQEWGIHTVIVNRRGMACPNCIRFAGLVFIDDVYSGGSAADGPFPLLSTAIAGGLYHPRCKDSHTTYFEGVTSPPKPPTQAQIAQAKVNYNLEQQQRYNERQIRKFKTLEENSLDVGNKALYAEHRAEWQKTNREFIAAHSDILRRDYKREKIITS